ncbi:MAG: glutathione S-transferase C-terminal domain-containing protein [Candidatus Puniceispirillales bacterium WSBS_2018_MAG_OTU23]
MKNPPIFYDLISKDGAALSPWCWHARMAIAHKGITPSIIPLSFVEIDQLVTAGGKSFPLMVEDDGTISDDSKTIVERLEIISPEPTLFPGGAAGRGFYSFLHRYIQTIITPTIATMVLVDIPNVLDEASRSYFIESREKRFGKTLAEVCADRDASRKTLSLQLDPFRKVMQSGGGFISGDAPAMADYLLFGTLQWARVCSPYKLLEDDDAIAAWMEVMLDLFDGLGRHTSAAI